MNKLTRRFVKFACIFAVGFSATLTAAGADGDLKRFDFERIEMGVVFRLSVYGSDSGVANKAAEAAYARVRQLNGIFSDYQGSSEVRRLCEISGPGRPVKVSDELFSVFEASMQLSRETGGAFDVTVGPLTKLWRRARRREVMPERQRLAAERKLVGFGLVRLNAKSKSVELLRDGMRIDFGGIAKGFAADEALSVLQTHGFDRSLVDASGDIVAGDPPPDTDAWVVEIEALQSQQVATTASSSKARQPQKLAPAPTLLRICNQAVATSGDAYRSVVIAGRRYSHIVDPQTGLGLTQRSSVTIIAASGMMADGLASAVSVLGPSAGIELLERPGMCETEGYLMFAEGESDEVRAVSSSGFCRFLLHGAPVR